MNYRELIPHCADTLRVTIVGDVLNLEGICRECELYLVSFLRDAAPGGLGEKIDREDEG